MLVLGIETSCDETGLAIYDSENGLLADELHSQIAVHQDYGGVVPELASRDHADRLLPLLKKLLESANKKTSNSDLRYNDFEGNNKESPQKTTPAIWGKVGRNSQCPCGSGKKYKNCHGKN